MATAQVLNWDKTKVGDVELAPAIFDAPLRKDILNTVVKWQLAKRRQGTHATKTRGEVRGGGRKPFKQKGTGNARQGSNRSPIMPGGGITFGPQPRDYSFSLPKKIRQAGLRVALSHLNREGRLFVVAEMKSDSGKTGELSKRLKKFGVEKALLVDSQADQVFGRAARNLTQYKYFSVEGMNVFDLLKYDTVVLTKESLDAINHRLGVEKQS